MQDGSTAGNGQAPMFEMALFRFLKDLKANNDREWFHANKSRYEAEARDPMLWRIPSYAEPLPGISQ